MYMNIDIAQMLSFGAILVMVYCLWLVLSLKPQTLQAGVGKSWNILMGLVLLFTLGYMTTPFVSAFGEEMLRLVVGLIFLFGALYVLLTVKLIHRVISELSESR